MGNKILDPQGEKNIQRTVFEMFKRKEEDKSVIETSKSTSSRVVQIDGHNDMPWQFRRNLRNAISRIDLRKNMRDKENKEYWLPNHTDFERAEQGGLTAQFWVAYVRCDSNYRDAVRQTFEQIDV